MADEQDDTERTEDPTQKRLDEALERGDVVKSQEVNTWFVIAGGDADAGGVLRLDEPAALTTHAARPDRQCARRFRSTGAALLHRDRRRIGVEMLAAVALPFLLLVLAALAGNMIQHRLVWSAEPLKPKLSKISPLAGFKRLFSEQALANFAKGLIKLARDRRACMAALLWPERHRLDGLVTTDSGDILPLTAHAVARAARRRGRDPRARRGRRLPVPVPAMVRAAEDVAARDEGGVQADRRRSRSIKGKIRQLRQSRMRKRMMAAVPKASVIITNPTHYAIALQYERGMDAPICVAKGVDAVALKIREVAGEHAIPIVENPPLARALHATVEIDQEIPPEHYKAVAEVIGYVMKLRRAVRR